MIEAVVISKNQEAFMRKMCESLLGFCLDKSQIHYVLDRCVDNSADTIRSLGIDYKELICDEADGRKTCTARNAGLDMCKGYSDVMFLDGDRYVIEGRASDIYDEIPDGGVLLLPLEEDERTDDDIQERYGHFYNRFYTPGVVFTRQAIARVVSFQRVLWEESVQRIWGVEDTYMGDALAYLNIPYRLSSRIKLSGAFDRTELEAEALMMRLSLRGKLGLRE